MKKKIGIIATIIVALLLCTAAGFHYKSSFRDEMAEDVQEQTDASQEEEDKKETKDSSQAQDTEDDQGEEKNREEASKTEEEENTESFTEESVDVLEDIQNAGTEDSQEGMEDLKDQLEAIVSGYEGDWAIYVYDLKQHTYLELNSHPVKAASLIKLYIMGAVLDKVDKGELTEDSSLDQLLRDMITVSDNESANELVRRLDPGNNIGEGMKIVNAYAQSCGYGDTSQGRNLRDFRETPVSGENYTSVKDCAMFMKSVYDRTCVSPEASDKMLELLKGQTRTWKIPAGVPVGTVTANKTGELSDTENDTAIVYSPGTDYVLAVTSTEVPNVSIAQKNIVDISSVVYQYFNP